MTFNRRRFLSLSAASAVAAALPSSAFALAPAKPSRMRVVFFTDTHIQPELKGDEGTALAMRQIKALKPDLCIQGGDHCFDLFAAPRERSMMLLDMYAKTSHLLDGIEVRHTLGNHDVFGRAAKSGVAAADPLYGKKSFEQQFNTKTCYSFDRGGYHFIILDSIGLTPDLLYEGRIDSKQAIWLAEDLAAQPEGTPIIVTTHIPLVSALGQYKPDERGFGATHFSELIDNSYDVLPLFDGHNVIAVLQGHNHINETVYWRNVPYITSGAVCGNWWRGTRWGTPEGFTVLELDDGKVEWRYDATGWKSVAPDRDFLPTISNPRGGEGS